MPSYLVKPKEPTVFGHKEYHELSSSNLMLSAVVPTAHIIPEILDIERFNVALSEALSSFPLPAGRLVRPDTPDATWMIRLTNSGVPVSVVDSDADEIFQTDFAIQPTIPHIEPLNFLGIINTEGESDEPLFRLTITRFTKLNSTSIGASRSHVLFDGHGFLLFFRQLSQLYQGLGPIDPPPYHEPEAIKFPEPLETPTPLFDRIDPSGPPPWEQPERKLMEFVGFRLTDMQLTEIHNSVTKGIEGSRITRMDTVMGLLARCLSELKPESKPIDTISYLINHRGMGIYPLNAVVNAFIFLPTGVQLSKGTDPHDDVLTCATNIRKSMEKLKDPKWVHEMAANVAKVQSRIAWDRGGYLSNPKEGCLVTNITRRFGWRSPHFGHPGKTRFHSNQPLCCRYVKVTTSNPKFVDGAWISREDDVEGTLYVPPKSRKRFETLFEGYAKGMGMTGSVEFLP